MTTWINKPPKCYLALLLCAILLDFSPEPSSGISIPFSILYPASGKVIHVSIALLI